MTIYFCGHSYKYELEGICKLFFPIEKFTHCFSLDTFAQHQNESCIITRKKILSSKTLLFVYAKVEGKIKKAHCCLQNNTLDYDSECERLLCVLVHKVLSCITSITPKWGILTGVRPVAILQRLRKNGLTDIQITDFFKEKYLVSDQKLDLAFKTANVQSKLLCTCEDNSYSLYISIPFCASRCSYCSFVSHAIDRPHATDKIEEYLSLLEAELKETAVIAQSLSLKLDTIYVGGGTPTALSAAQLKLVTDAVSRFFPVPSAREYTIEAGRADTITKEKLEVIKNAGCKRISINPQTFNDEVLKKIGRRHTALQAEECFLLAREMGFEAINMDFIAGLPGDTLQSFKHSIDKAIALSPTNITVHTLTIKRSADLFSQEGIIDYAKNAKTQDMTDYSNQELIKAGYLPYYLYRQKNTIGNLENVGYSKPGFESLYNIYIMDELQTILACGAGGVTKLVSKSLKSKPISRIFNFKYHFEYISRFDEILKRKQEVTNYYGK